jgi:GTP-binding protein
MKINDVQFVKSALIPDQFPRDRKPEVAFVGRSNVGKSTLLNAVFNRKGLAKTSGTPGKTRTLNFFSVGERCYFVDLPGYGYAKVPKDLKVQWQQHMTEYLSSRETLRLVVALIDARHLPTVQDHEMLSLLERAEVPTVIAATKIDKLKRGQWDGQIKRIREDFGLDEDAVILPFSGLTREGVAPLLRIIGEVLEFS